MRLIIYSLTQDFSCKISENSPHPLDLKFSHVIFEGFIELPVESVTFEAVRREISKQHMHQPYFGCGSGSKDKISQYAA